MRATKEGVPAHYKAASKARAALTVGAAGSPGDGGSSDRCDSARARMSRVRIARQPLRTADCVAWCEADVVQGLAVSALLLDNALLLEERRCQRCALQGSQRQNVKAHTSTHSAQTHLELQ